MLAAAKRFNIPVFEWLVVSGFILMLAGMR